MNIDHDLPPAILPTAAPFVVPARLAASLVDGEDFRTFANGFRDWTSDGLRRLREGGWCGAMRTMPDIEATLSATGRAPAPRSAPPPASSAPRSSTAALPDADRAVLLARAARESAVLTDGRTAASKFDNAAAYASRRAACQKLDPAALMRRATVGDAAFAAEQAEGPLPALTAKTFTGLSKQVFARRAEELRRFRVAAGMERKPAPAATRPGAVQKPGLDPASIYARLNAAENRLPDQADVYRRRAREATAR